MADFELPLGKRKPLYRFFEMVPAIISYGAFVLLIVLALVSPLLSAIYLLLIITTMLVRSVLVIVDTLTGHRRLVNTQKTDWRARLQDLENPAASYKKLQTSHSKEFGMRSHVDTLRLVSADPEAFPKPSEVYNMVIIATYNEAFEVLDETLTSLVDATYDRKNMILVFAYEGRAGQTTEDTIFAIRDKYKGQFGNMVTIKHPRIEGEVLGKGANITYAAQHMQTWLDKHSIAYKNVIVTTLDSDNHPHKAYFDYLTYEFIVNEDRKHMAFQPIAVFTNNIWDVPAPMRVVATGNTFWSIISAMRPHIMRNFASHSQPMEALVEMGFWSKNTIVEDGHQFWRSYVHFSGNYRVLPMYISIYQDAVLDTTYRKTLKAQFIQLRRWMYGASDIAYISSHIFTKERTMPFVPAFVWLIRALDGYVTAASISIIVAIGGWIPLLINSDAYHDVVAHQLPDVISFIQQIALIGIIIMVFMSFKLLPPRPARYKRHRTIFMVLQWVLMPLTAIVYLSFAALNAQARLFMGRYLIRFDVTTKATVASIDAAKVTRHS